MKEKNSFKFRAWDTHEEVMNRVDYIDFANGVVGLSNENVKDYEQPIHRVKFMQYTGLKDKNGVEIYEGDVITEEIGEGEYLFAEVIYKDGCFLGKEQNFDPEYPISDFVKGKVIGNIYQNPELIKNET